jgi:hypothetical protein
MPNSGLSRSYLTYSQPYRQIGVKVAYKTQVWEKEDTQRTRAIVESAKILMFLSIFFAIVRRKQKVVGHIVLFLSSDFHHKTKQEKLALSSQTLSDTSLFCKSLVPNRPSMPYF